MSVGEIDPKPVTFSLTERDYEAFYADAFVHSTPHVISRRTNHKTMRSMMWFCGIFGVSQGIVLWSAFRWNMPSYVELAVLACIMMILLALNFMWKHMASDAKKYASTMSKSVMQLLRQGAYRGWLDEQTVTLSSEGVVNTLSSGHRLVMWAGGISRVVETDHHVFFYAGDGSSCIVPKAAFGTPEEAKAFASAAMLYFENAAASDVAQVRERLAVEGIPCPVCKYNLAGSAGDYCPECGLRLSLGVLGIGPATTSKAERGLMKDASGSLFS